MVTDDTSIQTEGLTDSTAVQVRQPPPQPRKPNRLERRRATAISLREERRGQKMSANRIKYYSKLQAWLGHTELPKKEADEVFRRTLKKLFSRNFKDDREFNMALASSIRSLVTIPMDEPEEEKQQEAVDGETSEQ